MNTASQTSGIYPENEDYLFEQIAADIYQNGFSIKPFALPMPLANTLHRHLLHMPDNKFDSAGIGRKQDFTHNNFVRTDEICWITGNTEAGAAWLAWTSKLQTFLNKRLLLGLFSFESHFAHYAPGDFYKRHIDAFKGESNRVLSLVVYLNPDWQLGDGGELVLYRGDNCHEGIHVLPGFGTIVAFLSEEFPHEVLPAHRDRYSIAGWYRLNSSTENRADPPA